MVPELDASEGKADDYQDDDQDENEGEGEARSGTIESTDGRAVTVVAEYPTANGKVTAAVNNDRAWTDVPYSYQKYF